MGAGFTQLGEAFVAPSGAFVSGGQLGLNRRSDFNGVALPPAANVDLDFANGIYSGVVGLPTAFLTTVRASVGNAVAANGTWSSFATNTPRITNLGLLIEESRT